MEKPALEHRLERAAQTFQVEAIGEHEVSVHAATRGLLPRDRQCGLRHIHSQHVQPCRRDVKGVLARPTSSIENRTGECGCSRQT
jgi:hypothetical protein